MKAQQRKIDDTLPGLMKGVGRLYRLLPVPEGGLGFTDLNILMIAARRALLIESGVVKINEKEKRMVDGDKEKAGKQKWQHLLTCELRKAIIEETKYTMATGGNRKQMKPTARDPSDSLWLSR